MYYDGKSNFSILFIQFQIICHRREINLNKEIIAIKRAIEPYQRKKAKERQINANPSDKKLDPSVKLTEGGGNTSDIVSGFVGVRHTTLKKAEENCYCSRTRTRKISINQLINWLVVSIIKLDKKYENKICWTC